MTNRHLTDRTLKALKPAESAKPYDVYDADFPGFGVRVSETGRKTFVLVARYPGSKNPTRRALGQYGPLTLEKARQTARKWREMVLNGIDPAGAEETARLAALRRQENSFATVAEEFFKRHLSKTRKGAEVERDMRREFVDRWAARPITDITRHDVMAVIDAAVDRGSPYQGHNLLGYVRRLFNWAIARGTYGLESSPCDRMKPKDVIGPKSARTRVLTDDEWRAFWEASEGLGYPYGPLFRLLALTGQRKSEVADAQWSEFDLGKKLWTIPAERMKADAVHVVPLTAEVIEILESLPRFKSGEYLFSSTFGKKPVNGFSKAKEKLDEAMLAEMRSRLGAKAKLPPFVIHDIRRTMRTGLSALPVPDLVRELVIAHTKPGLHKVYDLHAYEAEKRHALELWAAKLRSIVNPLAGNVVNFEKVLA